VAKFEHCAPLGEGVDNPGRRAGLTSGRFTRVQKQLEIDSLQHAAVAPRVEIMLHRRKGWKLARQLPPLHFDARTRAGDQKNLSTARLA
jgi:hypothetical protein